MPATVAASADPVPVAAAVSPPAAEAPGDPAPGRTPWDPVIVDTPIRPFEPRPGDPRAYRADTLVDGFVTSSFVVRAASTRGYAHRADGTPRQDDFAIAEHEPTGSVVVAVADGVSAAALSHVGAALAARQAVAAVLDDLDAGRHVDWPAALQQAAWSLVEHMRQRLGDDVTPADAAAEAERVLATALLVAVVRPVGDATEVSAVAVGDSAALTLAKGTFRPLVGGKAVGGVTVTSRVDCLPRVPAEVATSPFLCDPDEVVLLGSDGFSDPLGDGDGHVGLLFAETLARPPMPLRFAQVLDFSRETFDDDRTLVALWRRQEAE